MVLAPVVGGGAPCRLRLRRLLRRPQCRGHVLVAAPARRDPPFRGVGRGHAHEPQQGSPWQRGALVRQGRPRQGQRARPWGMSWGVTFRDATTTHPWGPGACAEPGCDSAWPRAPAPACKPRTRTVRLSGRSKVASHVAMVLQQGGGGSQGPARHLCTAAGLRAIVACVCDTCNLVIQSFLRVPFLLIPPSPLPAPEGVWLRPSCQPPGPHRLVRHVNP